MKVFAKQVINKVWKNLVMDAVLGTILLGHVQQANAQNIVIDNLKDKVVEIQCDTLMLDSNTPIKENCTKIINYLVSLHKDAQNEVYMIFLTGHYVGNHQNSYDYPIEMISFCRRWLNELYFGRLECMYTNDLESYIKIVLTDLYSKSLDKKFKVNSEEYDSIKVGNGYFYSLNSTSPLYKKIDDEVSSKINLQYPYNYFISYYFRDLLKKSKKNSQYTTGNKKKKDDDMYIFGN